MGEDARQGMVTTQICAHTPRVERLLERAHEGLLTADGRRGLRVVFDAEEFLQKEELRIASYRETGGEPMAIRRAKAFARICAQWPIALREDEPIVGSQRGNIWWRGSIRPTTDEQERRHAQIEAQYRELGIAFGEGHMVCDYGRVLRHGLRADAERIGELLDGASPDDPRRVEWEAMRITCEANCEFALRHAEAAAEAGSWDVAEACGRVPWEPATNLREAMQSFWFLHLLLHVESPSVAVSPGRMDQYLYPFWRADIDSGRLIPAEAKELLACLWLKLWEGDESQNALAGGVDAQGNDATNDLSLAMVEVTGELAAFQPSLSICLHPGTRSDFTEAAARLAARGTGQPSFFNGPVVRAGLESIGVSPEESWDWAIVGCYEAVVAGAEWGRTVAGGVFLPDAVLRALEQEPGSFEALLDGTKRELVVAIDETVERANAHERHDAAHAPSPFQSVLMRDCIEKGLDIYSGGARHNYTACWLAGLGTGVDALAAVRRCVYEERALGLDDLRAALAKDFGGCEDLRLQLLRAPKWGNDLGETDALAVVIGEFFCREVVKHRNPRGGTYQPSLAMYQQQYHGHEVGATPDGRASGRPFSAGIAPTQGRNEQGVTATLASCAKLPHNLAPNGNFLIISMSPEHCAGEEGIRRTVELVTTYFARGGSHVMLNVVDADTLREAQVYPERHGDLMVRISGLSAYFVTLPQHIQDEIIERTARGL